MLCGERPAGQAGVGPGGTEPPLGPGVLQAPGARSPHGLPSSSVGRANEPRFIQGKLRPRERGQLCLQQEGGDLVRESLLLSGLSFPLCTMVSRQD